MLHIPDENRIRDWVPKYFVRSHPIYLLNSAYYFVHAQDTTLKG